MMTKFTEYAADKEEATGVAINVEVMDASQSQLTQNEQVKSLIEKGCDVICVNLVDRTEPTTITDLAENKQVPIIFFNRELVAEDLERWSELYYVGADALQSGVLEGELAANAFKTNAKMDKNGDGICPVCGAGRRSRTSGFHRKNRVLCKHFDRKWCGSGKAGLCNG